MKPLVIANWKMNTTLADASVLATIVRNQLHEVPQVEVVLCPPYIWLQEVASVLEISAPHIVLGAQDCHAGEFGPVTGAVSCVMLKDLCKYVIVGHSERRVHFGETDDQVSKKAASVLQHGMTPIICVGERSKARGSIELVIDQLSMSLDGLNKSDYTSIVIAYEPMWSISTNATGEVATGEYASEVCHRIKSVIGGDTRVLYGGSVDGQNVSEFAHQTHIDGVLVGGASLKAQEFVKVVQKIGAA